ncbi:MAG: hypothetical protein J2P57_04745 [Acidimicrobiaceae bacterium]|nr:hypothetical protein [Acidimicrobiaceae bacterium]
MSHGRRLTAGDLAEAVYSWGRTLVAPPAGQLEGADVVAVEGTDPQRWSVWLRLWTAEEGRSDLTLEVTIVDSSGLHYEVELDNLEVA